MKWSFVSFTIAHMTATCRFGKGTTSNGFRLNSFILPFEGKESCIELLNHQYHSGIMYACNEHFKW